MSNYSRALEFFIENNIKLDEGFLERLKEKVKNKNNIKKSYKGYIFTSSSIPNSFNETNKNISEALFFDKQSAIRYMLAIMTHSNENKEVINFSDKYVKELDRKYTLYSVDIYIESSKELGDKTIYLFDTNHNNIIHYNAKITGKESDTLKNFLDKYHIKYQAENFAEKYKDRINIYNYAIKAGKKVLAAEQKKREEPYIGFSIVDKNDDDYYQEQYDDFISGESNNIAIISGDYDGFVTDTVESSKYKDKSKNMNRFDIGEWWGEILNDLIKLLSGELKQYGSIDWDGDNDSGDIELIVNK